MKQSVRKRYIYGAFFLVAFASCVKDPNVEKREFLESGKRCMDRGRHYDALIQFKRAIQVDPAHRDANYQLALAYLKLNELGAARRQLERIVEAIDPGNIDVKIKLGYLYLDLAANERGFFTKAKNLAESVLKRDPKHVDALLILGHAYAGLQDLDNSIKKLKAALEEDPKRIEVYVNLGTLQAFENNISAAEETFKTALKQDEKSLRPNLALASFYLATKRPDLAERYFKRAFEFNPKSSEAYLALAWFYLVTQKPLDSEKVLVTACQNDTNNPGPRRALGNLYLYLKQDERSIAVFEQLVSENPSDLSSRKRLAEIDLNLNRASAASNQIDYLLRNNENDGDVHFLRGRLLFQSGKYDEALSELRTSTQLKRNFYHAYYVLGLVHSKLGNLELAKALFLETLKINNAFYEANFGLARIYLVQKQFNAAIDEANKVIQHRQNDFDALMIKAESLLQSKKIDEAKAIYHRLIIAAPHNATLNYSLGVIALLEGEKEQALRKFEETLKVDSDHIDAVTDLVHILTSQNRYHQAVDFISNQLKIARQKAPLYELKARVHIMEQKYDEAEAALKKAMVIDKNLISPYLILAATYAVTNRIEQGLKELDESLRLKPNSVQPLVLKGIIYETKKDYASAAKNYELALQLSPDNVVAANNLAWIYAEHTNKLDQALRMAQKAKEILPDDMRVADTLGWVYCKRNNLVFAIDQLKYCVSKDETNPLFQFHLGVAYYKNGEKALAKNRLQIALNLDPNFTAASEARSLLNKLEP